MNSSIGSIEQQEFNFLATGKIVKKFSFWSRSHGALENVFETIVKKLPQPFIAGL
jgi:hypothetical protein